MVIVGADSAASAAPDAAGLLEDSRRRLRRRRPREDASVIPATVIPATANETRAIVIALMIESCLGIMIMQ
ncbi:hypothetical protein AKJ16_DCAP10303 [Drosera capensis]